MTPLWDRRVRIGSALLACACAGALGDGLLRMKYVRREPGVRDVVTAAKPAAIGAAPAGRRVDTGVISADRSPSSPAVAAAKAYLGSMERLMHEGCLGQIPEILDGDAPHQGRGCDAQAWGVTEALRVWRLLDGRS